jgi:UrcA family protein
MTKSLLTTLIAVALATTAGSALAANYDDPPGVSTVVRYADLNIESTDGAQALLSRIDAAAKRVCGPAETNWVGIQERNACIANTTRVAVAHLGSPTVTAAYTGKRASAIHLAQNTPR